MKNINRSFTLLILIVVICFSVFVEAQKKAEYKNLQDAVFSRRKLSGSFGPRNINWINNGDKYSFTVRNKKTKKNEIHSFNPKTLKEGTVFKVDDLKFPGTNKPFNYRSFQWAKDSKHLVFQTNFKKIYRRSGNSDYYIYSLKTKKLELVAKKARTAELSPNGSMVGYEREGNMFVYRFSDNKEIQLTNDGKGKVFNGHYDWVYEEEFGQAQAWNWAPDNNYIAYWQFDESPVPIIQLTDYKGLHPKYEKIPIPQVGDSNPLVKIGVVNVKTNKNIWINTGEKGDFYIPRIYWTSKPSVLAVMILNRTQNHVKVYFCNVNTGTSKMVFEEKSNTWIDVYDFYAGVKNMISFPKNTQEFFWISDRDGYQHLYRYNYSGKLLGQITKGNWSVIKVHGIDSKNKKIYYESTEGSPMERQLYSINFDGTGKTKISKVAGRHRFNMSPNLKYFIDVYSNVNLPTQVELWSTKKGMLKKLEDNKAVSKFLNTHKYSPKELFNFTASDGQKIDYYMIKPFNFDKTKKYPVIFAIYGGPGSQAVYNSFGYNTFHQYLAQKGYIIVDVNNRGTANYGSKFMKIVYKNLGKWESNDFAETAKYLSKLPYVDSTRIAIMGTSYGGYSTLFTMTSYPEIFKVGIANSPVTDWRLYDDIYTERYMGLINENKNGYIESSPTTHVANITGKLLLVHSAKDDNVHPRNTMQFITALTNAGKDADFRFYPPGAHGAVYSLPSYMLLMKVYYNFLDRNLNGGKNQLAINKQQKKGRK